MGCGRYGVISVRSKDVSGGGHGYIWQVNKVHRITYKFHVKSGMHCWNTCRNYINLINIDVMETAFVNNRTLCFG